MDNYLILNEDYVIRGVFKKFNLINYKTGEMYDISSREVLNNLENINGTRTLKDMANLLGENEENLKELYSDFISEDIIKLSKIPLVKEYNIPVYISKKENILEEVHLDLTQKCNLRCLHCFWGENLNNKKDELSINDWKNIIEELSNYGVSKITLSGGEVTLKNNFNEIVEEIIKKKIYLGAIFSNGINWNNSFEKSLNHIIKNKVNTRFYISLDGSTKKEHETIRGENTYLQTLNFLKKLIKKRKENKVNYRIIVNSFIHKNNYNTLINSAIFFDNLGVDRWRFTSGRIMGNLEKNETLIVEYDELMKKYVDLSEYLLKSKISMAINMENLLTTSILKENKVYLYDENFPICDYKENACSINPFGDIQFCTSWQSITYGNVMFENIEKIWNNENFRKMKEMKLKDINECNNCELLKYCGGGCRQLANSILEADQYACNKFKAYKNTIIPYFKEKKVRTISL